MVIVYQPSEHNYDRAVILDYHFPEVLRSVGKRTLSRYKPRNIFRSLQSKESVPKWTTYEPKYDKTRSLKSNVNKILTVIELAFIYSLSEDL